MDGAGPRGFCGTCRRGLLAQLQRKPVLSQQRLMLSNTLSALGNLIVSRGGYSLFGGRAFPSHRACTNLVGEAGTHLEGVRLSRASNALAPLVGPNGPRRACVDMLSRRLRSAETLTTYHYQVFERVQARGVPAAVAPLLCLRGGKHHPLAGRAGTGRGDHPKDLVVVASRFLQGASLPSRALAAAVPVEHWT